MSTNSNAKKMRTTSNVKSPLTAEDYRLYAIKSIENVLRRVNKAHDNAMKRRTSENIIAKINEAAELSELQTILYSSRDRLLSKT